ncbi:MAG: extracellular solute-binding protein [Clostridiales bacterium]|jgi:putative aldouronate transport system substrate-binding protein|nr:extracellular solute-binding protein [Clostridiales bacterium]
MKNFKKIAAAALGLTMLVSSAAGCGQKADSGELAEPEIKADKEVPSWKADNSSADLSWYINYDWFAQEWGVDLSSKFITEDTHVNITYMGGGDEKLNTMLASNDLPDILTIGGENPIVKDAHKFAYPLDELAAKYDPYFTEHAAKKEILNFFRLDDGHIYGYPNFSTTKADYDGGMIYGDEALLVRKDIYAAIGSPDMTTPQGFLSALKAVKDDGFTDAGGKEIIPFGMRDWGSGPSVLDQTLENFIGVPSLTDNNEYYDRHADADTLVWIKTIAQAVREGFASKEMVTMQSDTKDAIVSNGGYFAYFTENLNGDPDSLSLFMKENPDKAYIAVEGPKSTMGRSRALRGAGIEGWTQTFISKSCKNPQKAIELVTYLVSEEGDTVMNYGRLGETYTLVNGVPTLNADLLEIKQSDPGLFEKEYGLTTHLWLQDSARLSKFMGLDQFPTSLQQPKEWTQPYLKPQFELSGLDSCLSTEANRNNEKIKQDWVQKCAAMMETEDDAEVEALMAAHLQYRDANGWAQIVEEYNTKIKENIEKLNP